MKALGINNLIINPSATFKAQVKLNKMMVRDLKKLKPRIGQKLTEGLPLRVSMAKPRLSMKLLWKLMSKYGEKDYDTMSTLSYITPFLNFVESSMKPPHPSSDKL